MPKPTRKRQRVPTESENGSDKKQKPTEEEEEGTSGDTGEIITRDSNNNEILYEKNGLLFRPKILDLTEASQLPKIHRPPREIIEEKLKESTPYSAEKSDVEGVEVVPAMPASSVERIMTTPIVTRETVKASVEVISAVVEETPRRKVSRSGTSLMMALLAFLWIWSAAILGGLLLHERINSQLEILRLEQKVFDTVPQPLQIPQLVRRMRDEIVQLKETARSATEAAESYRAEFQNVLASLEQS